MGDDGAADAANSAADAPFVSTIDVLALAALGLVAAYLLLVRNKRRQNEQANAPFYSIVPPPSVSATSGDNSFVDKMLASGKNMLVVYGSQTGTAEEFSNRLAKQSRRYGMKALVVDPEECDIEQLPRVITVQPHLVVFVMATYGEGDPTDNAHELHQWLTDQQDSPLAGLNYTVFALGNKTYEHYNAVGKFVDKRLCELGANRVFQLGLGDDDANIEEDFVSWKEAMFPCVKQALGVEATGEEEKRQYVLKILDSPDVDQVFSGEVHRLKSLINQKPPFDAKNPYLAAVRVRRSLQRAGDRELMHIELDIEGSRLRYEAGDHVAVYPTNEAGLVEEIGRLLNTDLDTVFSLDAIDSDSSRKHPFPCPTSYRTALSHYLDITSLPKTYLLQELIEFTTDEQERAHLRLVCDSQSVEGRAAHTDWLVAACRGIVAVLQDLPSCRPPLDLLCELLPRLQPRYYSISSSSKVHPTRVHVTCVLVRYSTSTGRQNRGVATWWLLNRSQAPSTEAVTSSDHLVPCFVRRSQFRLPVKTSKPVILIGPGTGFAPMRGFIQERAHQKQLNKPVGETWLFYGCRHRDQDYMYQEELEQYERDGVIKLHVAFSRDQTHKVYVTHLLRQCGAHLWPLIHEHAAHVYVCGDARVMARDVATCLHELCVQHGEMTSSQAEQYVRNMRSQRRYQEDVWS